MMKIAIRHKLCYFTKVIIETFQINCIVFGSKPDNLNENYMNFKLKNNTQQYHHIHKSKSLLCKSERSCVHASAELCVDDRRLSRLNEISCRK